MRNGKLPQTERFLDVEEVANILNVPKSWVYGRTKERTIPMRVIGKYVRFDLKEILAWAKKGCPEEVA